MAEFIIWQMQVYSLFNWFSCDRGIIRNIWFWPDSLTMFMGNPSWVFPVEKALAGERIVLMSPTLVST